MLEFDKKIKAFVKENFTPGTTADFTYKLSTHQFLNFLFNTFPAGCIDDYALFEILIDLGYKQYVAKQADVKESKEDPEKKDNKIKHHNVWFVKLSEAS